jgi:hypothetical protein
VSERNTSLLLSGKVDKGYYNLFPVEEKEGLGILNEVCVKRQPLSAYSSTRLVNAVIPPNSYHKK